METDQSHTSSNNKRIAKNTLMLYARMLFSMAVSLYTSRVVLQVLGVSDYGVYSVVGGVVGMLGFLNATMSGATSRFLTYELGRGDKERLSQTFNAALIVHIGIAVFVFIVAETLGLWFVCHKLVIPDGRMTAAVWIYQFSILSAMVSITQVPYNASIIAHERMDIYAYVDILHTVLKLAIVYALLIFDIDKLILYGLLLFSVTFLIAMINRVYSISHYQECHFQLRTKRDIIKGLLSFSGYNLFGNFGSIFNRQGTNIVVNNFFGVIFNAACGISVTVASMISSFANNVITAFRPPITKSYAQGRFDEVQGLTVMAIKLAVFMQALVAIPAGIELDYLYHLWLVEVPEGSVLFSRLIFIAILFEIIRYIVTIDIHATGKVKYVSLANGILMSLIPFLIYWVYSVYPNVAMAYVCDITIQLILAIIVIILAVGYIPALSARQIIKSIVQLLIVSAITCVSVWMLTGGMNESILRVIITTVLSCSLLSLLTYLFCLTKTQRLSVNRYVSMAISRFKR